MKKYDKAMFYYKQALDLFKSLCGVGHPNVASCHNNIAHLLVRQRRYAEALTRMEMALSILIKKYPQNHPLIVSLKRDIKDVENILLK